MCSMFLIFYNLYHSIFSEKVEDPSKWKQILKIAICVYLLCARHWDACFMYINRKFGTVQGEMVAA